MQKFLHILSNVTYGGGEQVLFHLCNEMPELNSLLLLRKSEKVAEQFKNALVPKSLESSYKNSSRPYLSIWR